MSSSVLMFMRCFWSFLLIRFGFKYWPLPYLTGATNNIEEKNSNKNITNFLNSKASEFGFEQQENKWQHKMPLDEKTELEQKLNAEY